MKRAIVIVFAFILLVSGCAAPLPTSATPPASSASPLPASAAPAATQKSQAVSGKLVVEDSVTMEPEATRVESDACKVEIGQKVYFIYEYLKNELALYACCEIKNVGTGPISIDRLTYNAVDKDGNVLLSVDGSYCAPDYLNPGDTAYSCIVGGGAIGEVDPKSIAKVTIVGEFSPTKHEPFLLKITQSKYEPPETPGDCYTVVCDVENDGKATADNIRAGCAFYDENGKLLGIIVCETPDSVEPGGTLKDFKVTSWDLPFEMRKKVATYKVIAFNYTG